MKNLRNFALAALALLGFAACQQEEFAPEIKNPTHSVTFVAGAPETKTTVDISDGATAKFAWTAEDVRRFNLYENSTRASSTQGTLTDGVMTIKASFDGGVSSGENTYVAVLNSANDLQILYKEAYPEDADILVSKAISSFDENKSVKLQFKREVAIAKMTLKGLDVGEVVNHITVSSTADIAGSYGVDGWNSTKTSLDIYSAKALDNQETYSIVANEAGEAVVWFTCIPQTDATLTVKVEAADGDKYTKTFSKPITLTRGNVKAFGVKMTKDAPKTYGYQKISSVEDYAPGDYIIVAHAYKDDCPTKGDFAIANALTLSSNKLTGQDVTSIIDNDVIYASDGSQYKLSLSGDKDNIEISNGTDKLGWDTKTNLKLNDKTTWSLSLNNGNGGSFILLNNSTPTGETERTLAFQSYTTSGTTKTASLKFAAYAVSNVNDAPYAAIELYKYQEVTPPTPKYSISFAEVAGGTLSATPSKAEAGAEVTLTATPDEGYAFNDDWTVKDADEAKIDVTDGKFTMPAKDVTVSGSFSKVDYTITKATCEGGSFTVKKNGVEVTKAQVGDPITLEASAAEGYEFDSWTVTNESTSKTVYVSENSFTMPGANVIVSANFLKSDVIPVYTSVANLIAGGTPTSEGKYVTVTLSNEEITKFYTTKAGDRRGVYFTVGTQEIELFGDIACPEDWVAGGWVSGTLTKCKWMLYNGTWELCPTDWTELTYAAPCATPVITLNGEKASITCATEGATVRYTVDGSDPTETSEIYTNSVTLIKGQTIKAKAFLDGHKASDVASATYSSVDSYEWDLTTASDAWENFGCVTYFSQPYGIKKVNAYIVNKSIDDFTKATPSKISVSVKSLCNGATTSKLTVYLVNSNGDVVGEGKEIIPVNASAASKTTYQEVVFESSLLGATGIMVKCTTFEKNVLINGVKYTVTY